MTNNMNKKLHYVQSEHNPQAMKELNQSKDWKPVNPCKNCDLERKSERDHIYGMENECLCDDLYYYNHEVYAQRKLLEYLIANKTMGVSVEDNEDEEIMMVEVETLKSMLKTLEASQ